MTSSENSEQTTLEQLDAGDVRGATATLIGLYGREVYGYLCSMARDEDAASDAFAQACENALQGLSSFRRESSLRTWFYSVARRAALRELGARKRQRAGRVSELGDVLEAPMRTATAEWRSTRVKDRIAELREALSPPERELLVLRVDRQLSWEDIALICAVDETEPDLKVAAARYRKQFERAKEKLKQLAREAGLLEP